MPGFSPRTAASPSPCLAEPSLADHGPEAVDEHVGLRCELERSGAPGVVLALPPSVESLAAGGG